MTDLVLSLFPGIDVLGRGFEASGFCVVRGPDTILDQRIEDFRGVAGKFDGVIGGPPCQNYSTLNRHRDLDEGDRLLREFLRVVDECRPEWWLMENVPQVPDVRIDPYRVQRIPICDYECGGRQRRLRHVQFGSRTGDVIRPVRTKSVGRVTPALTTKPRGGHDRPARRCAAQGIPGLRLRSLTKTARYRAIGNAVPLRMATALAQAVGDRGPHTDRDCVCGCGRVQLGQAAHATAACRKRMQRRREGCNRIVGLTPQPAAQMR